MNLTSSDLINTIHKAKLSIMLYLLSPLLGVAVQRLAGANHGQLLSLILPPVGLSYNYHHLSRYTSNTLPPIFISPCIIKPLFKCNFVVIVIIVFILPRKCILYDCLPSIIPNLECEKNCILFQFVRYSRILIIQPL